MQNLNLMNPSTLNLLLAGALLGAIAGACDPKTIGDETAGNVVCKKGETKPAEDGCNTCSCEGGEWSCTKMACGECQPGETMPAPDGCNTCSCVEGMWACTLIGCGATTTDGGMCTEGETMPAPDGCNTCTCTGGQWACTEKACVDTTGGSGADTETSGPVVACGDGVLDLGEQCDDGNIVSGDGCSATCTLEGGQAIQECAQPYAMDPMTIETAMIVGDALEVGVQHSGGCETHEFAYCWDGAFLESFPVQVMTQISHDANGDLCDALISEMLSFDLVPLKTAYQKSYQTPNGQVSINLAGWQGGQLLYSF